MKRFIKFPSIDHFRTIVQKVKHTAAYAGYDEVAQKPIYHPAPSYPSVVALATEKIHGTNASVCYSNPDGFWVQARKNICTIESDNAACAFHAEANQGPWLDIINELAKEYDINLDEQIITVYYEWCGGKIQKKTAVDGLEKRAIIFRHFKVSPLEPSEDEAASWFETTVGGKGIDSPEDNIFNIANFPTYEIVIDFEKPYEAQNAMVDLVENIIEPSSPVGRTFGIDGNVGEGMVVTFTYKDTIHRFKVKGDKHSKSKVRTLKKVDDVKMQKIQDVAQKVTPAWRLEQMFEEANDTINGGQPDIRNMGPYLKLVNTDILKEDKDIIVDAGLEPKEVFPTIARIAKQYYQEQLNNLAFG